MSAPSSAASELDPEAGRIDELARLARSEAGALAKLLALLEAPRWSARRAAIAALAALGELAVAPLSRSLERERQSETRIAATVDTLAASSGEVDAALVPLAGHADPAIVADVAQILGRRRNPRSLPLLIELLRHSDDNVALAAIEALGRVGGRAAVEALVEIVERDNFFRTFPAIDVLGRSADPRSVAPLAKLLAKPQYVVEAARALGKSADRSAIAPLVELLDTGAASTLRVAALALADLLDAHRLRYGSSSIPLESLRRSASDATVQRIAQALVGADDAERIAMCRVLGALQRESAAPLLAALLDESPALASAAAAALEQLGPAGAEQLRQALVQGDSARRQILLPLMPRAGGVAAVLRCLEDLDPSVRVLACDALAQLGDSSVVQSLFVLLAETNPRVVQAASAAIQSLGSSASEALAIEAARSQSPAARRAGLRILAYFGCAGAIDVFSQAVADPDPRVRDVALAGLGLFDHPRARALLLSAAGDDLAAVRGAAMRGLGQSDPEPDVIASVRRGLDDGDAWVRYYACQALGRLRLEDAAEAIARLLSDPAGQVRVAAVEALSHLKSQPALSALRTASESEEPDMRRAALIGIGLMQSAESLPILIAACQASEAATRLTALSALRSFASDDTLAVVVQAASDPDEGVRAGAIGLLASWPGEAATRFLIDALRAEGEPGRIAEVLATPAPGRIAGLLAALETADDELAPALTSVLGRIDPAGAALFETLRLPNVAARKAAAAMLAARGDRYARAALERRASEDPSDEVRRVIALYLTP